MPIDLPKLLQDEDIGEALGFLCELGTEDDPRQPLWFTVEGSRDITVIARDGSGGVFATVASSPWVFHASSEGQAGVIAKNVDEFVTLVVACPYWRDLLHFAGGGSLQEMRRAQPVLEASWLDDSDDNEAMREHLIAAIGITPPDDPVGLLFGNVTTRLAFQHAEDDSPLEPLFGRFTIDNNPMLKPYMD
jgi:hypothetical protein